MGSISAIASPGLNAAQRRLDVAAHNIANMNTDNFRALEVVQQTQEGGGVSTSVRQSSAAQPAGDTLANDFVEQMVATYAFKANLLTIQTEQRMLGTVIDIEA
jgi:flagellar hook protein FlgE